MDIPHLAVLQKNHTFLKENLQVDPVLDALYQACIFTQADYDRCRQAGIEKCEIVLETLKKKGVKGYKTLCAVLDTTQPFIKERLDKTSTEAGNHDLVYVNKDKLEAQYKKELAKKDGEIETLKSSIERLQQQLEQNNNDCAELEERMKKKTDELISEIERKEEEIEILKTALSKSNDELHQSRAKCEEMEKTLRKEQEAYDGLVGVPRSQSPDRVDNIEQVQHTGSAETMCQFSTDSCCDETQLRLLPCLHSACKPCLDHQATQAEENCIHCPFCSRQFTMDQTTVDYVRRNETANKVIFHGEMKCSYIEGDHDAKPVVYCHECDDMICSDCHTLHNTPKRNRDHRITAINQADTIPMKQLLKEANCRDRGHSDNKLQLFDHTCKKAICLTCVHGAHKYHQLEDLYQAYDVAKGQLEELVKKQQDKLKDVTDRMKAVTSHQTELGSTQRRLEQVATEVCKSVVVRFLHRQKQLMMEIQMRLQARKEMVQEKLGTLHDVHTSIVSAIDYTQRTLESTRREELIILTDVLQRKCDENLKRKLLKDDTEETRILLTFQGQKALEELIDTFGGIASSLDVDHIPDKQPTLQDLQKWIKQLTLKEEDTRKVHEGRWRQLGEIIHRITAGTVPRTSESQGQVTSQAVRPELLTSQGAFEAAKHFMLEAFLPSESPESGFYLKGYSGSVHIISGKRRPIFITCPKLQLNVGRTNTKCCHVTRGGVLVNSPPAAQYTDSGGRRRFAAQHTDSGRLQKLSGTCSSTPIPIPPSPSSVTLVLPTTQYWETHTRVGVVDELSWLWVVLEVGVGEDSQVDSDECACYHPRSWCVSVVSCSAHPVSLCTMVCLEGKWEKHYSYTMSATPGTQATLHYGVVLDVGKGRIGFIDIDRSVVLGKVDVEFREDLLPLFAVGRYGDSTVNMKVVSGEKILMSDIKKSLINEALS